MPTKSYKWTPVDFASAKVIDKLLTVAGIGNREFDRRTNSAINYGRVRDIRNGLKAPIRLSEFLIICDVCGADPVQTLRDIIAEAERLKRERADEEARRRELAAVAAREQSNIEATLHTLETDPMSLAAYEDPHKHDPDPDNIA